MFPINYAAETMKEPIDYITTKLRKHITHDLREDASIIQETTRRIM
jgi:hypothetical protein